MFFKIFAKTVAFRQIWEFKEGNRMRIAMLLQIVGFLASLLALTEHNRLHEVAIT